MKAFLFAISILGVVSAESKVIRLCSGAILNTNQTILWDFVDRPSGSEFVERPTTYTGRGDGKVIYLGNLNLMLEGAISLQTKEFLRKFEQFIFGATDGNRVVLELRMYKDGVAVDNLIFPFSMEWDGVRFSIPQKGRYYNAHTNQFDVFDNLLWFTMREGLNYHGSGTFYLTSDKIPRLIEALKVRGYDWPTDGDSQRGVLLHGGR